ncbi:MAG: folylpolyglutamate synthase/dihydrofolate synthase family protein [Gemmataceae bacterium]
MTYEQALAWWAEHVNYEQRPPAPEDLKLERMRCLLARLGNPHRLLRILHVAGSKGKGSLCAILAAILQRSGYRTGLFTSPHLVRLEERYQIDGQEITADELAVGLSDVCAAVESTPMLQPTFFEISTALAFLHFWRRRVQAVVLEVGLGGRLDSTNVCQPELCFITSISFDHMKQLGNTLALIAREKAGIIKPGVPVISGVTTPEPRAVIETIAQQRSAPLRQQGRDFFYRYQPGHVSGRLPRLQVTTSQQTWPTLELQLFGEHQAANASLALAGLEVLRQRGWAIPDRAVREGLAEVHWPARMEVVCREPLVVVDCAHNAASAAALVQTLAESFGTGPRVLVFAASQDKDIMGMFAQLRPAFDQVIFTRYVSNPRAVPPSELQARWGAGQVVDTPTEALSIAMRLAPLVCVTGSVFLAGEVRDLLMGAGKANLTRASSTSPSVLTG